MSNTRRILIVDDDEDILELLKYNLTSEGFTVKSLSDSSRVLACAEEFKPHLIILDLLMKPYNGFEVCESIRSQGKLSDVYIFFLTANSNIYNRNSAYTMGGDEYVEKMSGLKPLLAKIKGVLTQNMTIRKRLSKISIGNLELVRSGECVYSNGTKIVLNESEFEILFFLAQNPGKKISVSQLLNIIWGSRTFMDENTLKKWLYNIRDKIGQDLIVERNANLFQLNSPSK
jgi:two-component system, OmpR family, alkaline phosphatase synthesis response regulator PhoP